MLTRILVASGLAAGLIVSAANAATITNMDKTAQTVTFTPKGGHAHHYTLAANHHRTLNCSKGGTLALGKSALTCDAKTAKITIRSGKLVM
jgi:hypothetical protein